MNELYEKMGLFYLGKKSNDNSLALYKSKHLTTHAMLIGMTGSGKTGLGIGLIEEAAIDNIPSIVIDPKGDMGNLCLAFAKLEAKEFEPWLEDKSKADSTASMWKEGIESSHQDITRVQKFASIDKTIYTPGSSAGISVNILGSFQAPSKEILEDSDTLSSIINASVSSLLALVSIEGDSISSKEHLLLSKILYHYYTREISLTLEDIIGYIASPPFDKVGLFSLKTFYPQQERMKLAMALNGVISSVSFASWIQGEALDIQNMLYDENGKAKIAIFSIAHLDDKQRMFFVTLLLNAYISWMRKQRGTSNLKNLLYMDEIFGFFPPTSNPPSKKPMLLLLKQARAFGTGIILSTQNPVDIDYKGLSNIGTWFVGKLQTPQDIKKVLEPLMAKSKLSKEEITKKIATLKGRHFFLKNVHAEETIEFSTRWVLSFLKGPISKNDIKLLMKDKKTAKKEITEVKNVKKESPSNQKQILSQNIKEYYLDSDMNSQTPFYPYLYASAHVRFYNQKRSIDELTEVKFKLDVTDLKTSIEWNNAEQEFSNDFSSQVDKSADFVELPSSIADARSLSTFGKSLANHLYVSQKKELYASKSLKLESTLGQTKQDFLIDVTNKLKELRDEKFQKIQKSYETKIKRLEDKLNRLEIKLEKEEGDVSSKTTDTLMDIGLTLIGAFFGKRSSSSTTMRRGASAFKKGRGISKEKDDVKNVEDSIQDVEDSIQELQIQLEDEALHLQDTLRLENYEITPVFIKPRRSDIIIKDIALLWEK